ncbi:MAG: bifunctional diaminohydroxyphosphoribosylaminopyrimidine deaminase/5-amino-6-(5-phosphoribosylamino)uracil reductase RibD [Myxococcota bacterium]
MKSSPPSAEERMRQALTLAAQGLGRVWPNPAVGCLVVRDGVVVGQGRTADGGRPHAEAVALAEAGPRAAGATVYVTLEPCSHWGRTPPCSGALIEAGVARVVIAVRDPDPRVDGRGHELLKEAGILVEEGVLTAEAEALNAGFFHRLRHGRPLVAVTEARDAALAATAQRWDAVLAHPRFEALNGARRRPGVVFELDGLELDTPILEPPNGRRGARDAEPRSRPSPPPGGGGGGWVVRRGRGPGEVPGDASGPDGLRWALAALGERGLTRLLVHADDPVAASLDAAGLLDLRLPSSD